VMKTRTDKVPNTSATAASSGADLNGHAVRVACEMLRERLAPLAATMLGAEHATIRFECGRAFDVANPAKSVTMADLCTRAHAEQISMSATGFYRTPGIHYDRSKGKGTPFYYFAYGAAVSEVEVDAFTGDYRLLRVDILEDVGDSISPLVDRGQIEGGFIQGLGWLTLEELVWDSQGRLATAGASTYKLPSWSEMPDVFNVDFLERATEPGVVFGSKAVGEPPLMLAISAREAIRAAVAAFGDGGPVTFASPATPERVFFAIRQARDARASLSVPTVGVERR